MMLTSKQTGTVRDVALLVGLIVALWVVLFACPGCRKPDQTWGGNAISCVGDGIRNNWSKVYPEVQSCLVVLAVDPVQCLDALPGVLSVGIEVVACIVRGTGQEAAMQANANPGDVVSRRKADRANQYLIAKGFAFQE
jgi:hypothetical protein